MKNEIRIPKQKRSIEKKNNIIKAAYELFNTVGYFRTDTPTIALHANVATGTIYSYFKDKKSILYYVIDMYTKKLINNLTYSFKDMPMSNIDEIVNFLLYSFLGSISSTTKLRKELIAISCTDIEIEKYYTDKKLEIVDTLASLLYDKSILFLHQREDTLFIYNFLEIEADQFSNEVICSKFDRSQLVIETSSIIKNLIIQFRQI